MNKENNGQKKNQEVSPIGFIMNPQNFAEAQKCCELIAKSDFVPRDFKDKPGNVLVAIQMGMEVGLKPLQALQNIAVINGRPSMWGDAVVAIVRASGTLEYLEETWDDKTQTATCTGKRKGEPREIIRSFSIADAQKAGLIQRSGSNGTWATYPRRMAGWRAKSWVLRDGWSDHLKGISIREEVEDIPKEYKPSISIPKAIETEVVADLQKTEDNQINEKESKEEVFNKKSDIPHDPEIKSIVVFVDKMTKRLIDLKGIKRDRILMHCRDVKTNAEIKLGIYDDEKLSTQIDKDVSGKNIAVEVFYIETADWGNEVKNIETLM